MKKSLAVMLALIMVLCMIPTTAFAEAGDWNPLTNPDDVKGEFAGNRSFTASTTMEAGKDGYLRLMPTLDIGNYTYNAMAYCGATATSNNTSIVEVKSIEIGKWVGGEWNDAHCLQVTVNPKAAGTTTVVINFYYTFSQSANPLTNPKAQWFYGTSNYTINVTEPTKPTKPSANDIPGIVGNGAVKVHCTNAKANHANDKSYGLMPNSYTVSEVEGNAKNGYTCTITVQSEKYVNDYNASINVNHKLDGSSTGTIKLKWNETDKKWEVVSALPVVFDVKCETTQPPTDKPEPPKPDNTPAIPGLTELNEVVKVKCKTAPKSHKEQTFGFNWSSYEAGEPTLRGNDWFCTITILPGGYVDSYNALYYSGHTLDPDGQKETLTLKWNDTAKQWENTESAKLPITFTVKCETVEHTVPDKPGEGVIFDLINKIKVQCIANTDPKHPEMGYDPIEGSYDVGEVSGDKEKGYTCDITVQPEKYVKKYNDDVTGTNHTLAAGEGNKTVTLKYDSTNDEWKVATGMPVVFKVTCETVPEETYYIVTYTDGVGGAAFADQAQRVKRGNPTPAFNGTPSRSGYTFTGWTPAVTDTVTDNVTYTAQWKNNDNHTPGGGNGGGHSHYYPTTTPVPVIVIPPKTGDMTIWQSILHFLGIR